ncbi:AraC family transcriptional regulator [Parahaliea mediterranea]|uniref:AraC family transcriptional regulator ligand-binding domain-containing protein n=1 Tax=Parahaliea mediterranea TaxID=651086 RepID=A0A939DG81_9GAMM|nr:AraC family transcriptional regulator [Parahaliea mediterranea]MBN7796932.1 AraC family transcriptional regulator ligand-binding domain-containing protein [Parahaliea mediterranea]
MPITITPKFQALKLIESARSHGADVSELLTSIGVKAEELKTPEDSIPTDVYCRLLQKVAYISQQHWCGLPGSKEDPVGGFRVLCRVIANCNTLGQALERSEEFYALYGRKEWGITFQVDSGLAYVSIAGPEVNQRPEFKTVHYMYILHRFWSWLCGQIIGLEFVNLVHRPCDNLSAYQGLFECPIHFGQEANTVVFDASYLDAALIQSELALMDFVETAPYELLLAPEDHNDSITAKIRYLIGSDFTRPLPSFEEIIDRLHTSASTLRRKLKKEGTTYQKIKDDARKEAAMAYLKREDFSVTTSAFIMGFDDPSAFTRCFKRWTGMAPSEYRAMYVESKSKKLYSVELESGNLKRSLVSAEHGMRAMALEMNSNAR